MHFSLLTQHNLALWNIFLLYKVALKYIWLSCNDCILFLISDIPSFKVSSSLAWTTGINNLLVSVSSLLFVTGAGIVLLNHTSTVVIVTCVVGVLWFPFPPEWNVIWNLLWNTEAAPLCGSGRGCGQGPGTLSLSPEIIHLVDLDRFQSSRGRPQDPLEPVWSMSTLKHTAQFLQPPPQLSSRTASTAESSLWAPPLPRLPLFSGTLSTSSLSNDLLWSFEKDFRCPFLLEPSQHPWGGLGPPFVISLPVSESPFTTSFCNF